jgi:NAD(P)-dependent dehydrogenase (short-subunit alcohol dehydrogenase family)
MSERRVAVVTGASSGIGLAAAKALARDGWQVIALGRDPQRSAAAEAEIRAVAGDAPVHMICADLALMSEAARAADAVAAITPSVHVLVNNAGGMTDRLVMTPEGLEENFAGNHLGPFLLTQRLTPLLRRAAVEAPKGSVRIVNVASDASEMIPGFDWDDLQGLREYRPGAAYCRSKLANVLHARGLAARLAADGIVAHAVHPGTVASNFITHADEQSRAHMRTLEMMTPDQGADTVLWLATAEEAGTTSGGYFCKRRPRTPNPVVEDAAYVQRLWAASEGLVEGARAAARSRPADGG